MKTASLLNGWTLPVVAVGMAVAYAFGFFLPQQRSLAELSRQVTSQHELIDQTAALAPALAATEQQIEATRQYTTAWETASPSDADLPMLFGQIHQLAKMAGVTTTRFDPDTPVTLARVRRIPLRIGCTGQFSQIARFLESVERLPQTVWVENLHLERGSQAGEVVQCEVMLEVFADKPENSDQVKLSH